MTDFRVLVVDPDPVFARLLRELLKGNGCLVRIADMGRCALEAFAKESAVLVLLELALPDMEGIDVCREIRAMPGGDRALVVCLTGKQDLADKVASFHAGADDYLTKPVDLYELSLRVQAIRRQRTQSRDAGGPTPITLSVGPLSMHSQSRTLQTPGGQIKLTPSEYQLMTYLMSRPGTFCSAETLLTDVWRYHPGTGSPELVRFHVRSLRKKIEPDPNSPTYLVSVPHHGYMIAADSETMKQGAG